VATKLKTAIDSRVDYAGLIREALPPKADPIAPALGRGVQSFIDGRVDQFTRGPRFQQL
jgi:hypothetical protein